MIHLGKILVVPKCLISLWINNLDLKLILDLLAQRLYEEILHLLLLDIENEFMPGIFPFLVLGYSLGTSFVFVEFICQVDQRLSKILFLANVDVELHGIAI